MKFYKDSNNDIYAYELDGSQDAYIKESLVPITNSEADSIREAKQQAEFDALTYSQKRKGEYPAIGDQLDALYHAGVFPEDMAAQIQAVKEEYPKP